MLRPIAPDIWHLDAEPLRFPGGLRLPLAATVIRLPDRSLLIYSPVALDDAAAAALAAQGEVAHIVAPSLLHHMFARAAAERYPRATVHAPRSLAAKQPALRIDRELGVPDPAWDDALDVVSVAGAPKLDETVFLHRPSGTLVCADLLFNVTTHDTFMTTMILKMMGVGAKQLAQSRMWKLAVRDRDAARTSLSRVLAWPIQRVAPTHGEAVAMTRAGLAPLMRRAYGAAAIRALAVAT